MGDIVDAVQVLLPGGGVQAAAAAAHDVQRFAVEQRRVVSDQPPSLLQDRRRIELLDKSTSFQKRYSYFSLSLLSLYIGIEITSSNQPVCGWKM